MNTETFEPEYIIPDMRILVADTNMEVCNLKITPDDVILAPKLFCDKDDFSIYNKIMEEMEETNKLNSDLWKLWHGDTHLIADDHINWKKYSPTFNMIINKIEKYFKMDIKATRLNWYRNTSEWKPYHHDAAAVDPKKAENQNFTVGVSFGTVRDISFQHAQARAVVSFPLKNGDTYCFSKDVNIYWRHGVPQLPPEQHVNEGRISIIAWGKINLSK